MALTAREPEGSFDDPEHVESWSLGVILSEQPDLIDDATTERPGTYAKRVLSHWGYSRF